MKSLWSLVCITDITYKYSHSCLHISVHMLLITLYLGAVKKTLETIIKFYENLGNSWSAKRLLVSQESGFSTVSGFLLEGTLIQQLQTGPEVQGSSLGPETGSPHWYFCGSPPFLQINAEILVQITSLLPCPFQIFIHYSSCRWTLYSLACCQENHKQRNEYCHV
jgi:hypothetical protein